MQRFVYAKVYCDLLRHPRFRNRPDCDIRLVLGLILEAKENTADGVIRELTPENARSLCHIKAPVRFVKAALEHLVLSGWLIPHPENAYEIKDFLQRQERDSASERMKRHRDAGVTKRNAAVTRPSPEVEVDEEEEEDNSKNQKPSAAPQPEFDSVFSAWQSIIGKPNAKPTKERRRKVKERLAEGYSVGRLISAIHGCKRSPHHQGKNDTGTKYEDLELICRDGKHVEMFEALVEAATPADDRPRWEQDGFADEASYRAHLAQIVEETRRVRA